MPSAKVVEQSDLRAVVDVLPRVRWSTPRREPVRAPPVSRAQLHELRFSQLVHRCQEAVLGAVEPLCQAIAAARHLE